MNTYIREYDTIDLAIGATDLVSPNVTMIHDPLTGGHRTIAYCGATLGIPLEVVGTSGSTALQDLRLVEKGVSGATGMYPVSLDLPSGTRWASCNYQGTTYNSIGEYCDWAGNETHIFNDGHEYSEFSHRYVDTTVTPYNWIKYNETDGLTQLEDNDDAIYVGTTGQWRLPSRTQFLELINNTDQTFMVMDGIYVCKFTSMINPDNYIYMPAQGGLWDNNSLWDETGSGCYITSNRLARTGVVDQSQYMRINNFNETTVLDYNWRYYGYMIRPVLIEGVTGGTWT